MTNRIFYAAITAVALGFGASALAAGNGSGGGSHGGGNGGVAGAGAAGMDAQKSHGADKSSHTGKTPSEQLAGNKKLSALLASLLPANTNLDTASEGFKNLGQFVAAVHVSANLGISFADVKEKMMNGDSLGAAIKALQPKADADAEARKAQRQSAHDTVATK